MFNPPLANPVPNLLSATFDVPPGAFPAGSAGNSVSLTAMTPSPVGYGLLVKTNSSYNTLNPTPALPFVITNLAPPGGQVNLTIWLLKNGRRSNNYLSFTWTTNV
jgi:hypothetical protein